MRRLISASSNEHVRLSLAASQRRVDWPYLWVEVLLETLNIP